MMWPRILVPVALVAVSCGTSYITGTSVPDTAQNRVIVDLVEKFRVAVEKRDMDTLKDMISRRYFTNAGTTAESSDDYGYEQLDQKVLPLLRDNVKSVMYQVFVRKVEVDGGKAYAEIEHSYKFFYVDGGKDRWAAKTDLARLEFAWEGGVWRIVGGL